MSIGQILIGKNVAYAALRGGGTLTTINEINDLADGAMAIFNEDGHFVDAAADFLDSKTFFIAVGGPTAAETRRSKTINRQCNIVGRAYVAPVKERIFLGDDGSNTYDVNLPATLVVGNPISITVEQFTEINMASRFKKHYEYVIKTGDTKSSALTALIALVNADADRLVNLTGIDLSTSNAGIQVDFINVEPLKVYGGGDMANATIVTKATHSGSNAILPVVGNGTAAQILALEKAYMLNEGDGNTVAWKNEMFSYDTQTDSAATYTQWVINWTTPYNTFAGQYQSVPQHLILALYTGASQNSTIATLLAAAVSVGVAASLSESGVLEENETIVS